MGCLQSISQFNIVAQHTHHLLCLHFEAMNLLRNFNSRLCWGSRDKNEHIMRQTIFLHFEGLNLFPKFISNFHWGTLSKEEERNRPLLWHFTMNCSPRFDSHEVLHHKDMGHQRRDYNRQAWFHHKESYNKNKTNWNTKRNTQTNNHNMDQNKWTINS